MHIVTTKLYKLQEIEMGPKPGSIENQALIQQLRTEIPEPILRHYDRLRNSGKTGIAPVRNQSCTGCHMQLPVGTVAEILAENDVKLCDNCARYLIILEEDIETLQAEVTMPKQESKPEPIKVEKPAKKRVRKKPVKKG
ncbi:MAG TPA: C4-type zinc ribbon domain-containing protein [Verrucomicrobiota bacterium]|nr:C4-type zinc ribbon domain-containing protein [Verrucomicrobiota bacterium]